MLKWQIYIISVSHQNQNNGLPCCSTPRRISFLCFVLIQTSLHEGDAWYHFVVIFTCLLLTLYFICNSMAINLIWIELKKRKPIYLLWGSLQSKSWIGCISPSLFRVVYKVSAGGSFTLVSFVRVVFRHVFIWNQLMEHICHLGDDHWIRALLHNGLTQLLWLMWRLTVDIFILTQVITRSYHT